MRRVIDKIYIHHSESSPNTTINEIRKWHVVENGWRDVGYHFFLDRRGIAHIGRPIEMIGAHVQGDNATSIGVCLAGDFDICPPQGSQFRGLVILLKELCTEYNIPPSSILGHCDGPGVKNKKSCPGKFLYDMLPKIRSLI